MLDEGINYPKMNLYIDLNRTINPRRFLQRMGRILRVMESKTSISVITFMDITEGKLEELLVILENLKVAQNKSQPRKPKCTLLMKGLFLILINFLMG